MQTFSAAGQQFYQAQQAEQQATEQPGPEAAAEQPAGSTAGQEDVVEADYEIVDEGKK